MFRDALDRCAGRVRLAARASAAASCCSPRTAAPTRELLNQTGYTQPALFAFEYALAELWRSWGIEPDVVMGHSVGEIAAMCVAGGVSLEDGLKLIAARGRLMQALPSRRRDDVGHGGEARVLGGDRRVARTVAIAAINGPGQVVISGAGAAVAEISART